MRLALPILALLALALPAAGQVPAFGGGSDKKAAVELIVARTAARPGETVPVGVKFTMQPGWHVYWTNPGDAGQPPSFRWNLPTGNAMRGGEWTATAPDFPTPTRFESGGLVGYGYGDTVIFPAEVTVPASATPGQAAEVAVVADYLICADVCIPEEAVATATITVAAASETDDAAADEIAEAVASLPSAVPANLVKSADVSADGRTITVHFSGPVEDVGVFPDPPAGLLMESAEVEHTFDKAVVTLAHRPMAGAKLASDVLPVVIGYTAAGDRRGVKLDVSLTQQDE